MTIYLCLSFLSIVISLFVMYPHIVISPISIFPLLLFTISVLEVFLLKGQQNQSVDDYRLNNTAYSIREIDLVKINSSKKWLRIFKKISLPLFFLFVLYFHSVMKCIFSILIFVSTYILSRVFVMIENRRSNHNNNS